MKKSSRSVEKEKGVATAITFVFIVLIFALLVYLVLNSYTFPL